jgi:uncharacterized membrane protein (DUF485 family)
MSDNSKQYNWEAIAQDPRFREIHSKKGIFLASLMIFSIIYYFALPLGAIYMQDLFKVQLWGPLNFALVFALSEFAVAWGIAFYYSKRANNEFDKMTADLAKDAHLIGQKSGGRK